MKVVNYIVLKQIAKCWMARICRGKETFGVLNLDHFWRPFDLILFFSSYCKVMNAPIYKLYVSQERPRWISIVCYYINSIYIIFIHNYMHFLSWILYINWTYVLHGSLWPKFDFPAITGLVGSEWNERHDFGSPVLRLESIYSSREIQNIAFFFAQ